MSFYVKNRIRVSVNASGPSMTKQQFKAECDINNILKQFSKTGIIDHINRSSAVWADLPPQMDYQESLRLVLEADEAFSTLPSRVRDRYGNDPSRFLSALSDASERDFLTEVGVFKKPYVGRPESVPQSLASDAAAPPVASP